MACPNCQCKTTYPYGRDNGMDSEDDDQDRERCAACGHVFYVEDHLPEDDDDGTCGRCGGDGMDPFTDYLLPCPECGRG